MAATLQLAGLDSWEFITSRDPVEVVVKQAVTRAFGKLRAERERSLANEIANAVGKMLSGKS